MTPAKRSAAFLLMAIAAAALPAVAQLQLNPLVTVLARATGPVPEDCATGETTPAPRVVIGEPAPEAPAESGALLAMLNRYPGFGHALADATMEIDGKTVYPTREARQFLAAEGA